MRGTLWRQRNGRNVVVHRRFHRMVKRIALTSAFAAA